MLLRSAVNRAKEPRIRTREEIDADICAIRDAAEFKYQEEAEQRRREREERIAKLKFGLVDQLQDECQKDHDDEETGIAR